MWTDLANAALTDGQVTWCHSECCVPSGLDFEATSCSILCYCLSSYLLQGHQVTVNMILALFCG